MITITIMDHDFYMKFKLAMINIIVCDDNCYQYNQCYQSNCKLDDKNDKNFNRNFLFNNLSSINS